MPASMGFQGQMVSVLFMDIRAYSMFPEGLRSQMRKRLEQETHALCKLRAVATGDCHVNLQSGGSAALVFFRDLSGPLECALFLRDRMEHDESLPRLRMGLHVGPAEFDENAVPVGEALDVSRRLALSGGPGEITASTAYAELVGVHASRYDSLMGAPRVLESEGRTLTVQSVGPAFVPAPRVVLKVTGGIDAGRVVPMEPGLVELGRGDPYDRAPSRVNFAEPSVSRVQASIWWDDAAGTHIIRHHPAATNPTLMGGAPFDERVLRVGEPVACGVLTFVLEPDQRGTSGQAPGDEPTVSWGLDANLEISVERGDNRDFGHVFPLTRQVTKEGRMLRIGGPGAGANDISLYDEEVDNAHARLQFRGGKFWLFANHPTIVNGVKLEEGRPLRPGDRIVVGGTTLVFREVAKAVRYWLEYQGRRVRVKREMRLGRSNPCEILISDPNVSRHHATIFVRGDGCWLREISATNPTLVNGVPIVDERKLEHGDEIRLSDETVMHFVDAESDVLGGGA